MATSRNTSSPPHRASARGGSPAAASNLDPGPSRPAIGDRAGAGRPAGSRQEDVGSPTNKVCGTGRYDAFSSAGHQSRPRPPRRTRAPASGAERRPRARRRRDRSRPRITSDESHLLRVGRLPCEAREVRVIRDQDRPRHRRELRDQRRARRPIGSRRDLPPRPKPEQRELEQAGPGRECSDEAGLGRGEPLAGGGERARPDGGRPAPSRFARRDRRRRA